jgi:hypothetical protein
MPAAACWWAAVWRNWWGVDMLAEHCPAALPDDLVHAGAGQPAPLPEPRRAVVVAGVVRVVGREAAVGKRVPAPLPQVTLQRLASALREGHDPGSAPLAPHLDLVDGEVDALDGEAAEIVEA